MSHWKMQKSLPFHLRLFTQRGKISLKETVVYFAKYIFIEYSSGNKQS